MTSQTLDLQTVVERLEKVEAQNRRLKWAGVLVVVVVCAVVLMGQASPKKRVVEAERFILRDAGGNMRAWLGVDAKNWVGLSLFDKDEKPRVGLTVYADGSADLKLRDAEGTLRAGLEASADGKTNLVLYDVEERGRVGLFVLGDGLGGLSLYDAEGKNRVALGVESDGGPYLSFFDAGGKRRIGLNTTSDLPRVALNDADGVLRAVLGSTSLETIQTGAVTKRAPSSLVLFDKEGKVIFQAP